MARVAEHEERDGCLGHGDAGRANRGARDVRHGAIRVQHKQLSLERNHVYRVNNADVAKRCRDGINAALAAKPRVDLAKLRAFSR